MHIEQHHQLGKEEVKKRADALTESLVNMPIPGGVSIGDISREWKGDELDFAFRVSQGFFGANINGSVLVSDASVALDIKVPPIVSGFMNEEKIQAIIENKMAEILK
jgi:hypothetical protein